MVARNNNSIPRPETERVHVETGSKEDISQALDAASTLIRGE